MQFASGFIALIIVALLGACAETPAADAKDRPAARAAQVVLASSDPADGSTVESPVDNLKLQFVEPAALSEVIVTSSDGTTMPMMITPAGEVLRYDLPLPGLGPGSYQVAWRAKVKGVDYSGNIRFAVR